MSVWDWIGEFREETHRSGDRDRTRLLQLYESASNYCRSDPDIMLGLLNEGRALAERLGEAWWVLFYDHWRLQALLHFKGDYREAVDIAVRATLEARKPQYANLPQRVCLHEDLIHAYVGVDPEGHAERITQALDYMTKEVKQDVECRFCIQQCRSEFALRRERWEEAKAASLSLLAMADDEPNRHTATFHSIDACADLCAAALALEDWETLRTWANAGEEMAQGKDDKILTLARFLVWKAILARRDGDEERARRLLRGARSRVGRVKAFAGEKFYDAWSAYHEQGAEWDAAFKVREVELAAILGKGRLDHEARCRLKRCRLLAKLGQPLDEERQRAREAAHRLKSPQKYLEELDKMA